MWPSRHRIDLSCRLETDMSFTGREMRSTISDDAKLALYIEDVEIADPGDDEVVVRIEAAPVNPSDLVLMLGPADPSTMRVHGDGSRLEFAIPPERMTLPTGRPDQTAVGRIGQTMPVGIEGAGTVVAAGKGAEWLMGKLVGLCSPGMYSDYRKIPAIQATLLPEGVSAVQGAANFINPMTALGFLETALVSGHRAMIQTAAASSVGQMFSRVCAADGIPMINIIRSAEQARLLQSQGARFVLNSKDRDFHEQLVQAVAETGATVVFDPIGGGRLGGQILEAMQEGAVRRRSAENVHESEKLKELFIYGFLDDGPTILQSGRMGEEWRVANWHLPEFLQKVSPDVMQQMRQRVVSELTTTFASSYTSALGLTQVLQPDVLNAIIRKATGEKFLIDPTQG